MDGKVDVHSCTTSTGHTVFVKKKIRIILQRLIHLFIHSFACLFICFTLQQFPAAAPTHFSTALLDSSPRSALQFPNVATRAHLMLPHTNVLTSQPNASAVRLPAKSPSPAQTPPRSRGLRQQETFQGTQVRTPLGKQRYGIFLRCKNV